MADEELMVLLCDKCGARLKLRPVQAKMLNEVKCGKCGNRIPTSKAIPISAAPPSVVMKMDAAPQASSVEAVAPAPAATPADVPPTVAAPPPAPPPVVPAAKAATPVPAAPSGDATFVKGRTASFGAQPGLSTSTGLPYSETSGFESPAHLRKRVRELEEEINVFRSQVLTLQNQIAQQEAERSRFQELLQRTADAEDRAAELQQLWYQKEKECRDMEARAQKSEQERDEMRAFRENVLDNIKDVLATYHATEVEAARKRLADLDVRVDRFVALMRARGAPPAPEPPQPIPEAKDHQTGKS